jgi:hypothetical protein
MTATESKLQLRTFSPSARGCCGQVARRATHALYFLALRRCTAASPAAEAVIRPCERPGNSGGVKDARLGFRLEVVCI